MDEHPYDYRSCSSLFGYAAQVHARSGGICELCGWGSGREPKFDVWRQLTVERLVRESQGGYLANIRLAVAERFPELGPDRREDLSLRIDAVNTISACSFCNWVTRRDLSQRDMVDLITGSGLGPEETYRAIAAFALSILERRRRDVEWKLASIGEAYEQLIVPDLVKARDERSGEGSPRRAAGSKGGTS
jgi:hypothetical protein